MFGGFFGRNKELKQSVSELCTRYEDIKKYIKNIEILMCIENLCTGETCKYRNKKVYFWDKETIYVECEEEVVEIKTIKELIDVLKQNC